MTHPISSIRNLDAMRIEAELRAGSSTSSGVSSVGSSLSSADPVSDTSFFGSCSAWFSSLWASFRNCLASLPLIGSFFSPASSTTGGVSSSTNAAALADAREIERIEHVFTTATGPLAQDVIAYALACFNRLQTPSAKWEALYFVMTDTHSSDAIARQFYDALPENPVNMKNQFKQQVYALNGSSNYDGRDHGFGLGDYIVHHRVRSDIAKNAALALKDNPPV